MRKGQSWEGKRAGKNNPMYGKHHSEEYKSTSRARNTGSNNPNWKGKSAGYNAIHAYVKARLIKPNSCPKCNADKPLDLSNKSGKYHRDLKDWEYKCHACHMKGDLTGRKHSTSTKKKISAARKRYWAARLTK